MRKESFGVGAFVHVYNRGNRKQAIVHDTKDRWRFLEMLRYFNDGYSPPNIFRTLNDLQKFDSHKPFEWPIQWPSHKPLVKILSFALLENHFHLLLKEIYEGGVTKFMRKLGTGMTNYYNTKYKQSGRLFQGAYRAKRIDEDIYFQYVSVYIQVKNAFECYPGGFRKAMQEFDKAYEWAMTHPYCSLGDYAGNRSSPIIDKDLLGRMFATPASYRDFTRQCLIGMNLEEKLGKLTID